MEIIDEEAQTLSKPRKKIKLENDDLDSIQSTKIEDLDPIAPSKQESFADSGERLHTTYSVLVGKYFRSINGPVGHAYIIKSQNGEIIERYSGVYIRGPRALNVIKNLKLGIEACLRTNVGHLIILTDDDTILHTIDTYNLNHLKKLQRERNEIADLLKKFRSYKFKYVTKQISEEANLLAKERYDEFKKSGY